MHVKRISESNSLQKTIYALILRPEPKGTELANLCQESGFTSVVYPLIEYAEGRDFGTFDLQHSSHYQGAFFVSEAAVQYFVKSLTDPEQQLEQFQQLIAVGPSTANALSDFTKKPVKYPSKHADSEGVLSLIDLTGVKGQNWLILSGQSGRTLVAETLKGAGANVTTCAVYHRQLVELQDTNKYDQWKNAGINCIVITSGEMLQHLFQSAPSHMQKWLISCQWVVISARLLTIAKDLGVPESQIELAEGASNRALIHSIKRLT